MKYNRLTTSYDVKPTNKLSTVFMFHSNLALLENARHSGTCFNTTSKTYLIYPIERIFTIATYLLPTESGLSGLLLHVMDFEVKRVCNPFRKITEKGSLWHSNYAIWYYYLPLVVGINS